MEWRQMLLNWIVGPLRRFTGVARGSANAGVSQSDRLMKISSSLFKFYITSEKHLFLNKNDGNNKKKYRAGLGLV